MLKKYENSPKNDREIFTLPSMPQLRVIRRIVGEYTYTGKEEGETFADGIGNFGDFRNRNRHYQVPYRCLYNKEYPNLLSAGRIVSATGDGMEVLRVIPCCALTGQAAGAAANLIITSNTKTAGLDVRELQKSLKNQKVLI